MTELALTSLSLSHFRSHKRVEILCDARPVALFGANGAGKTNILEAISLLSPGRGLRRASAEDMTRRPEALGWKIQAILQRDRQLSEIEIWSENNAARQLRLDGKAAAQLALARLTRVLWLVPSMDRLWIEGAEGRRRFLDRIALSFFPDHGEAVLTYEKAMRERNRLLKDQRRDAHWYSALERQMAEAGAQIYSNRQLSLDRLHAAQEAAETAFPTAGLELIQAEGEITKSAEALKQVLAENRPRDLAAGRSLIGPHRSDLAAEFRAKGVAARDCSTGEQKALLVSLILANARALISDLGFAPILLLDEVAAHLDRDRQAALYDEICALGSQAWMTGTGLELFAALGDRAQYFELSEVAGESQLHRRDQL